MEKKVILTQKKLNRHKKILKNYKKKGSIQNKIEVAVCKKTKLIQIIMFMSYLNKNHFLDFRLILSLETKS